MKKSEVKVGGRYKMLVNGVIRTVRVDDITERFDKYSARAVTRYDVTNLATGRKTYCRSAAKFRGPAD